LSEGRAPYEPRAEAIEPLMLDTWDGMAKLAANDFHRVVGARHPIILELADELASIGASIAMMSGSGSTVFGIFADAPEAAAITRSTGCTTIATGTSERVVGVRLTE
jgi:4-diphosphocytidyl-2-C-methyl-D-erythritol kinase